nr:RNA-directed DNA polymerase, eukaryota, reverse transcriptase zinc-binding domain protein [Tanacetum cinerariifolium]
TWSTLISNDMDSNVSDDDHDMDEHRLTNEDVNPNAALDDFIQQNIVKESALKDSKEGKCSTSFGNYKRKELKGFYFIDEMSQMIEVGGTLGYDVKGCKKSIRKMIHGIGVSMADK